MIRTGRVVQTDGETLEVCFNRMGTCESCGMCDAGKKETVIKLRGKAKVGDIVEVEMPDAKILKASFVTYVIPLVSLILGLWIGSLLFNEQEIYVFLTGILGLAVGLICVKLIDRFVGKNSAWQPRILSVTPVTHEKNQPTE